MGRERETGRETEREGSARPFGCVQAKKREIESLHLAGITGLLEAIKQQVVTIRSLPWVLIKGALPSFIASRRFWGIVLAQGRLKNSVGN